MNALVSIDVATLTPATVFAPGGVEAIVSKIEAEVSAEVFTLETAEGRERIKSVAYKVARSKTALDDMGKELVAGIKAQAATIDAERRTIRDRLDALKERVRGPLTAWEDAEAARINGHERALVFIVESAQRASFATAPTAATISERIAMVADLSVRDWQEFKERADVAARETMVELGRMKAEAEQAERDAAELAELRRLKAEREAEDRAKAQEAIEAENARIRAEEAAGRERFRAEYQAKRDQEQAEHTERSKIAAAARAVEQERERVARAAADEQRAAAKREANKKHRAKVMGEIIEALAKHTAADMADIKLLAEAIAAGAIPHVTVTY